MDEIMRLIYNAMWDYNYHFKLSVTNELLSRKRAYLRGLIDMAKCFIDKCTVVYESYSMNSKITDIIINDMSVTEWHEKEC